VAPWGSRGEGPWCHPARSPYGTASQPCHKRNPRGDGSPAAEGTSPGDTERQAEPYFAHAARQCLLGCKTKPPCWARGQAWKISSAGKVESRRQRLRGAATARAPSRGRGQRTVPRLRAGLIEPRTQRRSRRKEGNWGREEGTGFLGTVAILGSCRNGFLSRDVVPRPGDGICAGLVSQEPPRENALRDACSIFPFQQPPWRLRWLLVGDSLSQKRHREPSIPLGMCWSHPGTHVHGPTSPAPRPRRKTPLQTALKSRSVLQSHKIKHPPPHPFLLPSHPETRRQGSPRPSRLLDGPPGRQPCSGAGANSAGSFGSAPRLPGI